MKRYSLFALTGLMLAGSLQSAYAQRTPQTRDERRGGRQQANENLTPEQRRENFDARFQERLRNATPEQRQRMEEGRARMQERMREQGLDPNDPDAMRQMMGGGRGGNTMSDDPAAREAQWRRMMVAAGITEKNLQDDLLVYIRAEEKAREPLLVLARAAVASLARAPIGGATPVAANPATPAAPDTPEVETRITSAVEAYQNALVADKARHEKALQDLEVSTAYSTSPRIKAFLTLTGLLDNNAPVLTNPLAIFSTPGAGGRTGGGRGNAGATATDAAPAAPAQG